MDKIIIREFLSKKKKKKVRKKYFSIINKDLQY